MGFDVNVAERNDADFCRRRIKRLVGVEQIVERVPHRHEDEGGRLMLRPEKILLGKLSRSRDNPIVQPFTIFRQARRVGAVMSTAPS
jgi:hypothetical protein